MFLFLPLSLAIFALVPKYLKSYSLPVFGCLFYTSVNLKSPFALMVMPIALLLVIGATELYRKHHTRYPLTVCRVALTVAIFVVLALRASGRVTFISGVGAVLCLMSGVSLCSDVLNGKGRLPDTAWDAVIYMTFFPLFMVGPFVKYGDFVEKVDRLSFNINNFSSGAIRFIIGVLKCICVSAVLEEVYLKIYAVSNVEASFLTLVLLTIVCGMRVLYFFAGYSDMSRGIASMLGVRLSDDFEGCLSSVTPCDYVRRFCSGLLAFCRSYITVPVTEIVSGVGGNVVAAVFAAFLYLLIFSSRFDSVYFLMIPVTVVMLFIVFRTGRKRPRIAPLVKVVGSTVTLLTACFFWWFIRVGNVEEIISLFTSAAEKQPFFLTPYMMSVIGDVKYLMPIAVAVGCRVIERLIRREELYLDSLQSVSGAVEAPCDSLRITVAKYASAVLLLAAFCFAITILLPQYPELASVNYFIPFI